MRRIKEYIDRFFKNTPMNSNYSMSASELLDMANQIIGADGNKAFEVIRILFDYGYAKGYRACIAEQKGKEDAEHGKKSSSAAGAA